MNSALRRQMHSSRLMLCFPLVLGSLPGWTLSDSASRTLQLSYGEKLGQRRRAGRVRRLRLQRAPPPIGMPTPTRSQSRWPSPQPQSSRREHWRRRGASGAPRGAVGARAAARARARRGSTRAAAATCRAPTRAGVGGAHACARDHLPPPADSGARHRAPRRHLVRLPPRPRPRRCARGASRDGVNPTRSLRSLETQPLAPSLF